MARVVIEIDGDASGAEAALGEVQDSLGGLDDASESASSSFGGLNSKLVNVASAVSIAKTGFEMLRGGINMLWESTERYFTATEEGQEMWEDLERQGRALKGLLFELFIGTSDQTEAFERMSAIMGDLVSVGHGFISVISPVIGLFRSAFGAARSMALAIGGVSTATNDLAGDLADLSPSLQEAEDRMVAFRNAFSAPSGVETINNLAEELTEELGPRLAQAFEYISGRMFETLMETNAAREGFLSAGTSVGVFFTEIQRATNLVPDLRRELRALANTAEGQRLIWNAGSQAVVEWSNMAARSGAAASTASSGISSVSVSAEEATTNIAMMAVATANATLQILEQKAALSLLAGVLDEKSAREIKAEKLIIRQIETKRSRMEEELEAERAMMMKQEQLKDAMAEKEASRAARQQERVGLAKGGFQTLTNSAIGMAAAHIKAGKQSRDEIRKLIGDELVALGAMGLAQAAMMVFQPGKQALAVGLGVASVAAMALGAKMGANASGGGGVAAPASTQGPSSVTNVTFQNNFSQIGSRDQFLRVTGDSFQEAVDEGYIALPRGG